MERKLNLRVSAITWTGASLLAVFMAVPTIGAPVGVNAKSQPGDDLFGGEKIRTIRVELDESALAGLNRNERAYVRAQVRDEERVYPDVGIHLKGVASFQPLSQKPNFTVKFNQFSPQQRYHGLKKFMLNNSTQDPTFLAEQLSSQIFRDAGVPAPRATHAFVELNGRQLGLYVLVEAVTSDFLTQHFKNGSGALYEGYMQDIDQPLDQDGGADNGQRDLKKLLEICRIEDPVERWRRLPEVLEVDAYLAHCAVEMFIGHTDGYAMNRNNYRLYHDPATQRFTMIPHGLDWGFANAGAPVHPPTTSIITHAVLGTPEGQARYCERAL
ncbi:MAG: CotH kinase family protein [Gammaproteobacteria bacterium]